MDSGTSPQLPAKSLGFQGLFQIARYFFLANKTACCALQASHLRKNISTLFCYIDQMNMDIKTQCSTIVYFVTCLHRPIIFCIITTMKIMRRAFKFRLQPNSDQAQKMSFRKLSKKLAFA
jgi:hypothetical protein